MNQLNPFVGQPWLLLPDVLMGLAILGGGGIFAARPGRGTDRNREAARISNGVAVLPMVGLITDRPRFAGVPSWAALSSVFAALVENRSIEKIVLDIDSSGGSCFGCQEFADQVFRSRSVKPVIAVANSLACAGAYWVGSQASQFYMTPGGEAGGIGVYAVHFDYSGANEKAGVRVTHISAGKYKNEGNPDEPLSKDARAFLQGQMNDRHRVMMDGIARGRGATSDAVRIRMGKGRILGATAALRAGMVDGIKTFDQVLAGEVRPRLARSKASLAWSS